MKVFVNQKEISLFSGAKVIDALRAYFVRYHSVIPIRYPTVTDRYGNQLAPDGALKDGSNLFIQSQKRKTP